jgi:SAM-dependent methyltransferase
MLAAEMVGPSGSVVGIDRAEEAIAKAEARARESGLHQIEFRLSSVDEFSSVEPFDVAIGRCVLVHQAVPSDLIRSASRHVRPGGVIAFHEPNCYREFHSLPVAPLFEKLGTLSRMAFVAGFPGYDAAGRMVEHFHKAGLPHPELFAEVPIGGYKDVVMYAWMAETLRSLMPLIVKLQLASEEEIAIDTVEERLVSEAIATGSQVDGPIQVCAWARV